MLSEKLNNALTHDALKVSIGPVSTQQTRPFQNRLRLHTI